MAMDDAMELDSIGGERAQQPEQQADVSWSFQSNHLRGADANDVGKLANKTKSIFDALDATIGASSPTHPTASSFGNNGGDHLPHPPQTTVSGTVPVGVLGLRIHEEDLQNIEVHEEAEPDPAREFDLDWQLEGTDWPYNIILGALSQRLFRLSDVLVLTNLI
jgi:hypothetical protein